MPTTMPTARALLDVLLSGKYSSQQTAGINVTPEESRTLTAAFRRVQDRMRADMVSAELLSEMDALSSLLGALSSYDFRTFTHHAVFAGKEKPAGFFEAGGYDSLANFGWMSDRVWECPPNLSWRRIVYNNLPAPWGDRGPLWGIRAYNVVGEIRDLEMWRCGDWERGREGHAVYLNVAGNFTLRNFRAVQCGGQALQVVWRAAETRMLPIAWPGPSHTILLENVEAVDCGQINDGMAVRASWPFSFFGPGQRVDIRGLKVKTALEPFIGDRNETFQSHGGLLVKSRDDGTRVPHVEASGVDIETTRSDRAEVQLWSVDRAVFHEPRLVRTDGVAEMSVVDDCREVHIYNPKETFRFALRPAAAPYSSPYMVKTVVAGEDYSWVKP